MDQDQGLSARPKSLDPAEVERHDDDVDAERVASRARLLPEEEAAGGSDDPEAQAKILLEDSEARTKYPEAAPTTFVEHRASEDLV